MAWSAADGTKRKTCIACLSVYVLNDLDRDTGEWPQTWLVVDWPEGKADPCHLYLAWFKTKPTPKRSAPLMPHPSAGRRRKHARPRVLPKTGEILELGFGESRL